MIRSIGPENFEQEVITEKKPLLLLIMPPGGEFPAQVGLVEEIEKSHGAKLKVGFVQDYFISKVKEKYKITGTPTFLVLQEGKEKDRLLGLASRETLMSFILECHSMSR